MAVAGGVGDFGGREAPKSKREEEEEYGREKETQESSGSQDSPEEGGKCEAEVFTATHSQECVGWESLGTRPGLSSRLEAQASDAPEHLVRSACPPRQRFGPWMEKAQEQAQGL